MYETDCNILNQYVVRAILDFRVWLAYRSPSFYNRNYNFITHSHHGHVSSNYHQPKPYTVLLLSMLLMRAISLYQLGEIENDAIHFALNYTYGTVPVLCALNVGKAYYHYHHGLKLMENL